MVGLDVTTQGYEGAHFATFGPKLIQPLILASTSEKGCCGDCGSPWRRVIGKDQYAPEVVDVGVRFVDPSRGDKTRKLDGKSKEWKESQASIKTLGWQPTCTCHGKFVKRTVTVAKSDNRYTGGDRNSPGDAGASSREDEGETEKTVTEYVPAIPLEDHPVVPCTVLDPFVGSGTTVATALALGRRGWGIDLSAAYLEKNAVPRVVGALAARPALSHLIPRKASVLNGLKKK